MEVSRQLDVTAVLHFAPGAQSVGMGASWRAAWITFEDSCTAWIASQDREVSCEDKGRVVVEQENRIRNWDWIFVLRCWLGKKTKKYLVYNTKFINQIITDVAC